METKFLTVTEDFKNDFLEINKGQVVMTLGSAYIIMANPNSGQREIGSHNKLVLEPSSDRDLVKAWHHSTIERKYGIYATREPLRRELESRGYILSENGHRWKKQELVA